MILTLTLVIIALCIVVGLMGRVVYLHGQRLDRIDPYPMSGE